VQALRSLAKSRLTKAGDKSFSKTFTKTRKQYVNDPLRALTALIAGWWAFLLEADWIVWAAVACRSLQTKIRADCC
jgi:hypothetical protein